MHKGIKRRYMKRYWLITILLIINSYSFSQKKVTKSELKYNYSKFYSKQQAKIQSDKGFPFDKNTNAIIDSLLKNQVDTIGVFDRTIIGGTITDMDSCYICGDYPWETFIHWKKNNKYYQIKVTECCKPKMYIIDYSVIINYYINSEQKLKNEYIFPAITFETLTNTKGEVYCRDVDHTASYFIYCIINGNKYGIKFRKFELEERDNIFLEDNLASPINSWKKLIEDQLNEIEKN